MSVIHGICFDLGSTLLRFDGEWNQKAIQQGVDRMVRFLNTKYDFEQPGFTKAFNAALSESRMQREVDFVEQCTRDILRKVFLEHTGRVLPDNILDQSMEALYAVTQQAWGEMPGVRTVLDTLSTAGYRLAIISNAADAADVRRMIQHFNLREYFDPILISAEQGCRKPHQQMFNRLLEAWGVSPGTVVMVGDTLNADISGAQKAGMHQIWLRRDLRPHEDPADEECIKPEQTADSLLEVPALIENLVK